MRGEGCVYIYTQRTFRLHNMEATKLWRQIMETPPRNARASIYYGGTNYGDKLSRQNNTKTITTISLYKVSLCRETSSANRQYHAEHSHIEITKHKYYNIYVNKRCRAPPGGTKSSLGLRVQSSLCDKCFQTFPDAFQTLPRRFSDVVVVCIYFGV